MDEPGDRLRARGLRSTPQRRAILAAFAGGAAEHLSADEIYTRAEATMPDLSRGTVYATLAEFSDAGLIAAVGSSEAVRYETNTSAHAHFRCRLCLRIYDIDAPAVAAEGFGRAGHRVERFDLRAEGVCSDCHDYEAGVTAGRRAITRSGAPAALLHPDVGAAQVATPLGPMLLAASADGLVRAGFDDHGDVGVLRGRFGKGTPHARAHLSDGADWLRDYFSVGAAASRPPTIVGGEGAAAGQTPALALALALAPVEPIRFGERRPYHRLGSDLSARDLGFDIGANPVAILRPCHRVTRGRVPLATFVGGPERLRWLTEYERADHA